VDLPSFTEWPNVDALVFRAVVEILQRDAVVAIWIVVDALFECVGPVVEQDAAAGNAVLCPVVDAALVAVGGGAYNV
jgi:hypothetical protein